MKTLKLSNLNFLNLIFVLILFVFGRVFMGLNIATLRLGEILIGVSALFFVYFLIKDLINFKNLSKLDKNFTIYTRDPNLNGFEFNHGHNDYFNFVVFIKKKPFIIDIGRDNYSDNSKRYLLAKYHNSFFIGKKN